MTAYEDHLLRSDRAFLVVRDLLGTERAGAVFVLAAERAKERAAQLCSASETLAPEAVEERENVRRETRYLGSFTDRMIRDYEQTWEIGGDAEQVLADNLDEYAEAARVWHAAMGSLIGATVQVTPRGLRFGYQQEQR